MLIVEPMQAYHAQRLKLQLTEAQREALTVSYCCGLAVAGQAYTAMSGGEPVCCMGVVPVHSCVGQGWGLIPAGLSLRVMATIRAGARSFLDACDYKRIQIQVALSHTGAHAFARGLGFVPEARLRAYLPDGGDAVQYARIR